MEPEHVDLVEVDEEVLEQLVGVALRDAHPNEVTPPLSPGEGWTQPRLDWLRALHRASRAGLAGPAAQATWAVRADGRVVGAVRLARSDACDTSLELGIWLCRSARHRGTGRRALTALLAAAAEAGADRVVAETTAANDAAMALLRGFGFAFTDTDTDTGAGAAAPSLPGRSGGRATRAALTVPSARRR